jgi:hypothetical protein
MSWIISAPTNLCDQDDFTYNVEKVGNNIVITSDHNIGKQVITPEDGGVYKWLEKQFK